MVKKVLLALLLSLFLQASEVQSIVKSLLPEDIYLKNRSVIRTLFASSARYKSGASYDYTRIFADLEQVGIMSETFGKERRVEFVFSSEDRPFLLMYLSESALAKGNVYRYVVSTLDFSSQKIQIVYSLTATEAVSFAAMARFLKQNGVLIKSVRFKGNGWRFDLGMGGVRLQLPKVVQSTKFENIGEALWLDVCGAKRVTISSLGRYWHPKVAIYNASLKSLDLYKSYEIMHRLELALPNGACYIKISDIFTPKNIKRGFRVSLE